MSRYIDGFLLPIPRDRLTTYRRVVETAAEVWLDHGALEYCEHVGDDMKLDGTRSFTELADASDQEVVIFGWVIFESREARDRINEKVLADPRMAEILDSSDSGFDASRMAYGGFKTLVGPAT